MSYDSTADTLEHIRQVQRLLGGVIDELSWRAARHDQSKLHPPEKAIFDEFTPKLRDSTYGSEEYEGFRVAMGEALEHHYAENDHHPEHFDSGIADMDLVQLIELLCDWKAATLRHADGDLDRSITVNRERFGYGGEIERLLRNTARRLEGVR